MTDQRIARAQPSKAFFVDMITRDLTVEESILDLIDNSIDAAITRQQVNVMTALPGYDGDGRVFDGALIAIKLSEDRFSIHDTCGGISIEDAEQVVFRFGNPAKRPPTGGLSVYGIGMKRSFFKLGKTIKIESRTTAERFTMAIDVDAWAAMGDSDWDFPFSTAEKLPRQPAEAGTEITITDLTKDARTRLCEPGFWKQLQQTIETTYALFLMAGLTIEVNGNSTVSKLPAKVLMGGSISSAPKQFAVGGVEVYMVVGVSPLSDKRRHGWYVFCNGRMVLFADKTEATGWGRRVAKWHTKFGHFVGYLYFRSSDVRKLPWRTTKQGVLTELAVYQEALAEMEIQMRPVLSVLTKLYPGETDPEDVPERRILEDATGFAITNLAEGRVGFAIAPEKAPAHPAQRLVNIQYKRTVGEIDQLKGCVRGLSNASAKRVGEYAFDYLREQECVE